MLYYMTTSPTPFDSQWSSLTQMWIAKKIMSNIIRVEILVYRRQRVDYGEQDDTSCLVPQFACYSAGPSEICPPRISREWSRTATPGAVLQRAKQSRAHVLLDILYYRRYSHCISSVVFGGIPILHFNNTETFKPLPRCLWILIRANEDAKHCQHAIKQINSNRI